MDLRYSDHDWIAQSPAWSYADFKQRVWQIADQLHLQQIQSVTLWFEDSAKLACALFACWHASVRILLLPNLTAQNIAWANEFSDIWLTDTDMDNAYAFDQFVIPSEQKHDQNRPLLAFDVSSEVWLKTSGSSGQAKTIIKTAGQLWRNAEVCADAFALPVGNQITAVCTVSIQHLYGLICQVMMPFVLGWQIGRKQQFFPENVAQACEQVQQSVLISSPTMLASIQWQRLAFPRLQGIISAGGALASNVMDDVRTRFGFSIIDFYGTTEAGAIAFRQASLLWQPIKGATLGVDSRSALWIEADWVVGREQCEDVIEWTEQGFHLLGRADRIIKVGDKRISLVSIEQALSKHPFVSDCYVGKHPDYTHLAVWLALSQAGVQAYAQGRKALVKTLKQHVAFSHEAVALPRFWRFTDRLPRNSQSKISKLAFEQVCRAACLDQFFGEEQC